MHKVLLSKACPSKSVVRLTDRLDMVIAVDWGVNTQTETYNFSWICFLISLWQGRKVNPKTVITFNNCMRSTGNFNLIPEYIMTSLLEYTCLTIVNMCALFVFSDYVIAFFSSNPEKYVWVYICICAGANGPLTTGVCPTSNTIIVLHTPM